jgi:ABC-2 type transport system permease protein
LNILLGDNIAKHAADAVFSLQTIEALQYLTVVFFVSAFVLRFAFPSFSTEMKTAWIIGSAPVEYKKIFWAKFFFYSMIFVIIGLGVGWLNLSVLKLPVNVGALLFFYFFLAIMFVSVLGLALGAIYPNFETDDPQVLSTSLPGLGFIVASLLYGGLGAWLIYRSISFGLNLYVLGYITISVLIMLWLLRKATRSLDKIEFAK